MNALAIAIWIAVLGSTVLLLRGVRRSRPRGAGPAPRLHDLSEAAFMAGGPGTVVDAALVSMLGDGRLVVGGPGIVRVSPGARAGDIAERAVLEAHRQAPSGWLYQVRYAAMLAPAVQETGDALAARGLLVPPGSGRRRRRRAVAQAVVCGVLLVLSLPLTFVALALRPEASELPFIIKVFPVLLGGIVVGGAVAVRAGQRLTPAGRAALREIRTQYVNDRTPHVQTALYALRGLRDPYLREQLVPAARSTRLAAAQSRSAPRSSSSHSSSSSSSSSSGDSCGSSAAILPAVWCAGSDVGGGSGGGCGSSGSSCSSGSGCGSSSGSCASSGSGCSSGSSGSSCSSSSSCGSSSGSSCGSSS
ncbi:TIGR04222 domain-containing membrane protein [Streptomyces sp. NPDC097981]|uniref:TIGR04222 domain-containing membrane protein n=1 Tax=Streptomyces sp. NPDC097981 TaxID=3155428 RepID=UPI0033242870